MFRSTFLICCGVLLAQAERPLLMRLEREDRVRVFLALAAILAIGFAAILFAWLGARWTRRYVNRPASHSRDLPFPPPSQEDWASKRLHDDWPSDSAS